MNHRTLLSTLLAIALGFGLARLWAWWNAEEGPLMGFDDDWRPDGWEF